MQKLVWSPQISKRGEQLMTSPTGSPNQPPSTEIVWNPGVFIDIDGVVLQGGKPFEWSKQAIYV